MDFNCIDFGPRRTCFDDQGNATTTTNANAPHDGWALLGGAAPKLPPPGETLRLLRHVAPELALAVDTGVQASRFGVLAPVALAAIGGFTLGYSLFSKQDQPDPFWHNDPNQAQPASNPGPAESPDESLTHHDTPHLQGEGDGKDDKKLDKKADKAKASSESAEGDDAPPAEGAEEGRGRGRGQAMDDVTADMAVLHKLFFTQSPANDKEHIDNEIAGHLAALVELGEKLNSDLLDTTDRIEVVLGIEQHLSALQEISGRLRDQGLGAGVQPRSRFKALSDLDAATADAWLTLSTFRQSGSKSPHVAARRLQKLEVAMAQLEAVFHQVQQEAEAQRSAPDGGAQAQLELERVRHVMAALTGLLIPTYQMRNAYPDGDASSKPILDDTAPIQETEEIERHLDTQIAQLLAPGLQQSPEVEAALRQAITDRVEQLAELDARLNHLYNPTDDMRHFILELGRTQDAGPREHERAIAGLQEEIASLRERQSTALSQPTEPRVRTFGQSYFAEQIALREMAIRSLEPVGPSRPPNGGSADTKAPE